MIDRQHLSVSFDDIDLCDIVDTVNVLLHNLYWALVSWIQNYEALTQFALSTSLMNPELWSFNTICTEH